MSRSTFPNGNAMAKRHKFIIDYLLKLDNVSIEKYSCWKNKNFNNPNKGIYKDKVFFQNTRYKSRIYSVFFIWIEALLFLIKNKKKGIPNVLIFSTLLELELYVPFLFAKILGYKIFFDIVENYDAVGGSISVLMKWNFIISKIAYKSANGFYVISTRLEKLYKGFSNSPICILSNSAPPLNVKNHSESFKSKFEVVYAGTFAQKDGVEFLIDGFLKFRSNHNVNCRLVLIGNADMAYEKVLLKINAEDCIQNLGFVSEEVLSQKLQAANVLAMTRCNSEFANYGFPFKLSEYLSTGNIVIASNVGDITIYLKHKINAFIVEPENSQQIAEVLEYIYTNEVDSKKIGYKGIEVVNEYFNADKNGAKFLEFIYKCLNIKL